MIQGLMGWRLPCVVRKARCLSASLKVDYSQPLAILDMSRAANFDQIDDAVVEHRHPDTGELLTLGAGVGAEDSVILPAAMRSAQAAGMPLRKRMFFSIVNRNMHHLHLQGEHKLAEVDFVIQAHEVLQARDNPKSVMVAAKPTGLLAVGLLLGCTGFLTVDLEFACFGLELPLQQWHAISQDCCGQDQPQSGEEHHQPA